MIGKFDATYKGPSRKEYHFRKNLYLSNLKINARSLFQKAPIYLL